FTKGQSPGKIRLRLLGCSGPQAKSLDPEVLIRLNVLTTNNATWRASLWPVSATLRWPKAARHKTKEINIMKIIQKIGIPSVAFCLVAVFAQAAGKWMRPDATLQLGSGAVAAGLGISWGQGTLSYKGKQYPVSVSGL